MPSLETRPVFESRQGQASSTIWSDTACIRVSESKQVKDLRVRLLFDVFNVFYYFAALMLALTPGIIKHDCLHKLSVQYVKLKNHLLKHQEETDRQD